MKKELNLAIIGLLIVSVIIQSFDLGNYYIYRSLLVLYSLASLYLLWAFFKAGNSGSGMLTAFSFIFTIVLMCVQVMSVVANLSGIEYVLLSVAFAGISLSLLFLNDVLKD